MNRYDPEAFAFKSEKYQLKKKLCELHHKQIELKKRYRAAQRSVGKAIKRMNDNRLVVNNRHIAGADSVKFIPAMAVDNYLRCLRRLRRCIDQYLEGKDLINHLKDIQEAY